MISYLHFACFTKECQCAAQNTYTDNGWLVCRTNIRRARASKFLSNREREKKATHIVCPMLYRWKVTKLWMTLTSHFVKFCVDLILASMHVPQSKPKPKPNEIDTHKTAKGKKNTHTHNLQINLQMFIHKIEMLIFIFCSMCKQARAHSLTHSLASFVHSAELQMWMIDVWKVECRVFR